MSRLSWNRGLLLLLPLALGPSCTGGTEGGSFAAGDARRVRASGDGGAPRGAPSLEQPSLEQPALGQEPHPAESDSGDGRPGPGAAASAEHVGLAVLLEVEEACINSILQGSTLALEAPVTLPDGRVIRYVGGEELTQRYSWRDLGRRFRVRFVALERPQPRRLAPCLEGLTPIEGRVTASEPLGAPVSPADAQAW